jgi:hypothetical protein
MIAEVSLIFWTDEQYGSNSGSTVYCSSVIKPYWISSQLSFSSSTFHILSSYGTGRFWMHKTCFMTDGKSRYFTKCVDFCSNTEHQNTNTMPSSASNFQLINNYELQNVSAS